jgi:hypothetical protein
MTNGKGDNGDEAESAFDSSELDAFWSSAHATGFDACAYLHVLPADADGDRSVEAYVNGDTDNVIEALEGLLTSLRATASGVNA